MTNSTKRTAALIAASEAFNRGQEMVGKVFEAIAADYDDTPADAEWVSKREGYELLQEGRYRNEAVEVVIEPAGDVVLCYCDAEVGRVPIQLNPTRTQVAALEIAVGGKKS